VIDAVDHLKILREAVGLAISWDRLDALAAGLVFLDVVLAVVLEALLLESELDIDRVGHCFVLNKFSKKISNANIFLRWVVADKQNKQSRQHTLSSLIFVTSFVLKRTKGDC
jgi:hypothetical protein